MNTVAPETKKYKYDINLESQTAPAKIIRSVGKGKRVLEIGCASGVQSRILNEVLNCTVTGIEFDAVAAQEARKYCSEVIVGNLETLDFDAALGAATFDVVVIADVLEHLRNPVQVLRRVQQFVGGGCEILASIPNIAYVGLILEIAKGRFDYRAYGLLDDTHLRFFTLKSVRRLFEDAGLAIRSIDRVTMKLEDSEFYSRPASQTEQQVIDFIREHNPEWQTYQFIVSAVAASVGASKCCSDQLSTMESVRDLDLENRDLRNQVLRLEDQVRWLESRPVRRLMKSIRQIARK